MYIVEKHTFVESKHYTHRFPGLGRFTMTANISNSVNAMTLSTVMEVIQPITGFDIDVSPAHACINETVKVTIATRTGSMMVFKWDWNDSDRIPFIVPENGKYKCNWISDQ